MRKGGSTTVIEDIYIVKSNSKEHEFCILLRVLLLIGWIYWLISVLSKQSGNIAFTYGIASTDVWIYTCVWSLINDHGID